MLKLTKKRCINKRTASKALASIRRKRMISRRKRQVGGVLIRLPQKITFHVYPQPDKIFTDSKECVRLTTEYETNRLALQQIRVNQQIRKEQQKVLDSKQKVLENAHIDEYGQNIRDYAHKIEMCNKLANICPAKWYTVENKGPDVNIADKIPSHFNVTAISNNTRGDAIEIDDATNVFDALNSNYTFRINYSSDTANFNLYSFANVVNEITPREKGEIYHLVIKSQTEVLSFDELRKIINYYFHKLSKEFVQYIGEWTLLGKTKQVIAWTDIFINKDYDTLEKCSPMGQHASRDKPPCNTAYNPTVKNILELKDTCDTAGKNGK